MATRVSIVLWLLFLVQILCCNCSRILGIVPTPSYSHQVVFQPLWRELSLRGHDVTVLTTNPINDPGLKNLTEIDLSFSYNIWNAAINDIISEHERSPVNSGFMLIKTMHKIVDQQLSQPQVIDLLQNNTHKFDLMIVEFIHPVYMSFSKRFDCPYIGMLSFDAANYVYEAMGTPTNPVAYPDILFSVENTDNFFERVKIGLKYIVRKIIARKLYYEPESNLIKKHLGISDLSVHEILSNASLLFLNTDLVFSQIRPIGPNIVRIGGGWHGSSSKPLSANLKKLLDDSKNGFIYFSLGSNVKSKDISDEKLKAILTTFKELPQYTVLWKFESDKFPEELPSNVHISKWFPQVEILKHPNIKVFITQGGLQSLDEAIHNHVPLLGIPMFADQPQNVKNIVKKGIGLEVKLKNLRADDFKKSILELIENTKYKSTVRKLASLARDEPMSGLEKAVWWVEFVLRHNGAQHLKSPVLKMSVIQYYLLDVIGFLLILVILIFYMIFKMAMLLKKGILCTFSAKNKVE